MVGFPIRAPLDQSLLTAPQRLSQLTTPFIAFWCQGIHRTPFFDLTVKIEFQIHLSACEPVCVRIRTGRHAQAEMSYYLIHSLFSFQ